MLNRKFNSKQANNPDDIDALTNLFGGDGYHVVENFEEKKPAEKTFEEEQKITADEAPILSDRQVFSPMTTLSPTPLNRRLHTTPVVMPGEKKSEQIVPIPEEYTEDPKRWGERIRQIAESSRIMRLMNPVVYEARRQKTRYEQQNSQNRNAMSAVYRLIPEILRQSPATQCNDCKGNGCTQCLGWGYNLNRALEVVDLQESAKAANVDNDFHARVCRGPECYPDCTRKSLVDQYIRIPHQEKSTGQIKTSQVKATTGDRFIDAALRMTAVNDAWQSTAPALLAMGTKRPDEPLKKGTVCHFMNWDLEQPDSEIGGKIDTELYPDNEHIFMSGAKDKQMHALITSTNDNGTHNVIYYARPIDKIREEKKERERGRFGRSRIKYPSTIDALNTSFSGNDDYRKLTRHIANLGDEIHQFRGELSPLQGSNSGGFYGYAMNVPASRLAPLDPVGSAIMSYSGMSKLTRKRKDIRGWYTAARGNGVRGNRDFTPEQLEKPISVNVKTRLKNPFSNRSLREAMTTIRSEEVLNPLLRFRDDVRRELGIERKNFKSDRDFEAFSEKFDFGHGHSSLGETVRPILNETSPDFTSYMGDLPIAPPRPVDNPYSQFNSAPPISTIDSEGLDTSNIKIPMPDQPPRIEQVLGTPEGRKGLMDVIKSVHGEDSVKPEDEKTAIEGIRESGTINGGMKALGLFDDEDEGE